MTLEQKSLAELSMYLSEPEVTENPLLWWKMNSFRYPILSKLAFANTSYIRALRKGLQYRWAHC